MLHCGLRLSEVVALIPGNINLTKGKLRVESGKGKKDRDLAIPDYLTDLLDTRRNIRPKSNFFFLMLKGKKLLGRYIQ
jgi:integrase